MPITSDRPRLKYGCAGLDLDQDDNGGCDGNRGSRMKEDAEGAVVSIGVDRMHVRYLDYGEQRQQDKTH